MPEYNRTQTDSQILRTSGYQWGRGKWRINIGVGSQELQIKKYKINRL